MRISESMVATKMFVLFFHRNHRFREEHAKFHLFYIRFGIEFQKSWMQLAIINWRQSTSTMEKKGHLCRWKRSFLMVYFLSQNDWHGKRTHFHNSTMAVSSHSFDKNIRFSWKRINFEQKYKRLGANLINVNNFKQTTDEYKKRQLQQNTIIFYCFL